MDYQVYKVGHRYGGYGVPSYCEHPDCNAEIDRGMAHACGGEPFSEVGCDRYFCGKHLDLNLKKEVFAFARTETVLEKYTKQMLEGHMIKVDDTFWLVVKPKPKWMPAFIYRSVVKNLVEFQTIIK